MGEIADMMLEGTMCCQCGEWLHDGEDGDGYPMMCESCAAEEKSESKPMKSPKDQIAMDAPKVWGCSACKKLFRRKIHAATHCKDIGHGEPIDTTKVKL